MSATYEIPLSPHPQTLTVTLPNGTEIGMSLIYQFNQDNCWILNISDAEGNPLVSGIPLVTGADLLEQYAYLGLGIAMWCSTDGNLSQPPQWYDLGTGAHLWISG